MSNQKKVIITESTVRVITAGIQGPPGPPGANTFNDTEGQPSSVGTSVAAQGTSANAARRDHKHQADTVELDVRYGGKEPVIALGSSVLRPKFVEEL
jgi:hypothetical protein